MAVTLTSPINTATPPSPREIATADVNGDGHTDLVVLTHGNSTNGFQEHAVVLLGNGQGSFQTKQTFAVGGSTITTGSGQFQAIYGGWEATGIALADVDGDGKVDIVRSEAGFIPEGDRGRVGISLGNGDGTFQSTLFIETSGPSEAVAVGDVNGDGRPDIVTANGVKIDNGNNFSQTLVNVGSISVLLGDVNGTFQSAPLILPGHPVRNVTLANLDFNDLALEIVTSWWASTGGGNPAGVDLWDHNGAGGFNLLRSIPLQNGIADAVAVAFLGTGTTSPDFWPDILVATSNGLAVLNAPGGFIHDAPQYYATRTNGSFTFSLIGTESLSVADLDGDGKLDVVAGGDGGGQTYYLLGNGNGTFQAAQGLNDSSVAATFAKINGDGWFDIVTVNRDLGSGNGSISVRLSDTLPPELHSIVANTASTRAGAIIETVTFSEAVTGVDAADFIVTTVNGTATGQIGSITGSGATYTVTINGITGAGGLRLDLKATGTGIVDLAGRAITGTLPNGSVTQILPNATPVATAATLTTNEDTLLSGNLAGTDAESDSLTFAIVPNSATGGLAVPINAATGEFWFIPDENFSGTASFQFTASDGNANGTSAPQTVTINVAPVEDVLPLNSPPPSGGFDLSTIATTHPGVDTVQIDGGLWIMFGTTPLKLNVGAGGTLGGSATIGDLRVLFAGILAPGNSPGTLTMGDVSFEAGAKFDAEIGGTGDGEYDRLNVTGTVTLGGATLEASVIDGFDPETATGATFTLIDNDGIDAVDGTFANLAEGAVLAISGHNFSITYQGGSGNNDVVLTAVNDAPVIGGDHAVTVAEGGLIAITTADLTATDPDNTDAQLAFTVTGASHGSVLLNGTAATSFTNDDVVNGRVSFQHDGGEADGSFTVALSDGTASGGSATVAVAVDPQVNDAPVISGNHAITVAEGGLIAITTADLTATDPDNTDDQLVFTVTGASHGSVLLNGAAATSFTNDDVVNGRVSFQHDGGEADGGFTVVLSDGIASGGSATIAVAVDPHVNDAPSVGDPPKLSSIDVNSGAHLITQAALLANASDVDGPSLTAIDLQIANGAGTLVNNDDGTWTYTPKINDDTQVELSFLVTDGVAAPVAASATLDILPAQASPEIGTPGDDSFTAVTGNSQYDAGTGVDTIAFDFRLVDAVVTWSGNQVIIDGPSSHTVLSGFEVYQFTDGTVNNDDGSPLIDDLFYNSQNHDVWNAQVDADFHYNVMGWKEGRDPSAFFDTALYLTLNPDVRAAGVNPLTHYDTTGWKEGRLPSLEFGTQQYLDANPDVKAAQIDPLFHFLVIGASEGRQPIAPSSLIGANGFDFVYYLQHNPDVAAAHVDPLQHFQTVGWKEGRDPNASFDTDGYLAAYADVRSAGVNPFDHYNQFGWHEGRDPSVNFDTNNYLAVNPDVKAAGINPLLHFLQQGIHEGRSSQADGVWG
jgi:hypothetical protein